MTQPPGEGESVLPEIVEELEQHCMRRDDYRLYDVIDVEALQRVLDSGADVSVTFTVCGIQIVVTEDEVTTIE